MSVPTVEGERTDARAGWLGKKFRGSGRSLDEIAAHLSDAARSVGRAAFRRRLIDTAGMCHGGDPDTLFKNPRENRVGMAIEIEQTERCLVAGRRQARRLPR